METIAFDLRQMQRTPLASEHVAAIQAAGVERDYPAGTVVVRQGEPMDRFTYLLEGEIEVIDAFTGERALPFSLGPGQYMGAIAFLSGGRYTMPMRAAKDTRVVEVERQRMLTLMARRSLRCRTSSSGFLRPGVCANSRKATQPFAWSEKS